MEKNISAAAMSGSMAAAISVTAFIPTHTYKRPSNSVLCEKVFANGVAVRVLNGASSLPEVQTSSGERALTLWENIERIEQEFVPTHIYRADRINPTKWALNLNGRKVRVTEEVTSDRWRVVTNGGSFCGVLVNPANLEKIVETPDPVVKVQIKVRKHAKGIYHLPDAAAGVAAKQGWSNDQIIERLVGFLMLNNASPDEMLGHYFGAEADEENGDVKL